jgi:hypothetical protein
LLALTAPWPLAPKRLQDDDARVLGRKTVEYMLSNQIGPDVKNLIVNADPTRGDYGFGLGLAVRTTPGIVRMMGSVGEFNWPGATGTNWWAGRAALLGICSAGGIGCCLDGIFARTTSLEVSRDD